MTTQDLINTLKQGRPMTDRLMREIVRELEGKVALEEAASAVTEWWKHKDTHCEVIPAPMLIGRLAALVVEGK